MTPADLEQAMRQFEAQGGKVEVVPGFSSVIAARAATVIRPRQEPKPLPKPATPKEYPSDLVEAIRGFVDLGIYAAGKALRRNPETINKIAQQYGIRFNTNTAHASAERWAERASLVPEITRMAAAKQSQAKICRALGLTRIVLRDLAERHGININSRSGK